MGARRYVVYGAGAVGCALGGMLRRSGAPVVFVARGAQLDALKRRGLTLRTPTRTEHVHVQAVGAPHEVGFEERDIVLLCMKSQDTAAAVEALDGCLPRGTPIICAQNGMVNERLAAARFDAVYGMMVFAPVSFLQPGEVMLYSEPVLGGLDVGRYPIGADALVGDVVQDLTAAGFDARPEPRVLRLKYGKLLGNLGNALQALGGAAALASPLLGALQDEALACYRAGSIDFVPLEDLYRRAANVLELPIQGMARAGGSSWQSLARGVGSIEADHLNGEIVRLGEQLGVPTPYNRALVALSSRAAAERWAPEHLSMAEIEAMLTSTTSTAPGSEAEPHAQGPKTSRGRKPS